MRLLSLVVSALMLLAGPGPASAWAQGAKPSSGIALYRQLRTVGVDPLNVYRVRDFNIDREDLHLTFNDGTIAFLEPVNGHITGALFAGQGEVLLIPPNQVERQSLTLFTKAAVLSEAFTVAYLRFSDDKLVEELRASVRGLDPTEAAEFVQVHDSVAKALADVDALRTLMALTREAPPNPDPKLPSGTFMRAHVSGPRMGTFEVSFDTLLSEQISVAQGSATEKGRFYDQWTSFPMRSARQNASGGANASDQSSPTQAGLVVTDYVIRSRMHPPTDVASETTLTLDVRTPGDRTLVFELSRYLKVSALAYENSGTSTPLEFIQNEAIEGSQLARRGNDLVAVILPEPLKVGRVQLKFSYSGSVLADAGGGLLYVGTRGAWYPNLGPVMSNYDLEFHYPPEWKLLATGKLASKSSEADGQEVSRWRSERPIPFAGFNLGRYTSAVAIAKTEFGNIEVNSFATRTMEDSLSAQQRRLTPPPPLHRPSQRRLPGTFDLPVTEPDPAHNARAVAEQAAKTIDFLAPRLGEFPYSSLSLTQRPGPDSQGWPGLVFLSSFAFLSPQQRTTQLHQDLNDATQILYDRVMVAHEAAHQWWGDAVFWGDYRSEWMIEALANYCALLQLESANPEQFRVMMDAYRRELEKPDPSGSGRLIKEAGPASLGPRLNSSQLPGAYESVIYGRGTWLIHMLRHMFRDTAALNPGRISDPSTSKKRTRRSTAAPREPLVSQSGKTDPDALFFSVLRSLQEKLHGRLIYNRDLKAAFEAVMPASLRFEGKRSLDWFFDGWVDGVAIPRYTIEDVKFSVAAGKTVAQGLLHQQDAPNSLVTSVPVYARIASSGELVYVNRVFADGEETAIRLTVPYGTKSLVVDPYQTVLTAK